MKTLLLITLLSTCIHLSLQDSLKYCNNHGYYFCTTKYGYCTNYEYDCAYPDKGDSCYYCAITDWDYSSQSYCGEYNECNGYYDLDDWIWIFWLIQGIVVTCILIGICVYVKKRRQRTQKRMEQQRLLNQQQGLYQQQPEQQNFQQQYYQNNNQQSQPIPVYGQPISNMTDSSVVMGQATQQNA
ncbi:hypothetical protein PPERSA_07593 [Pseudocohnilembus persalinus]|uniref:Transmembrane protein n=1 Tax=Pseudocohnilembus persalinus TaxID=266149 RepID=A0A0V0QIC7_PSEPJ|nr:hypothetical protein PPERSA_07593 [Pseudocohnilembus persalinus]|eukprot:KRX01948.1 hypothetical protein PPERSA_07593 [Pseudocohnilembus persalinus]